jgi:hypothetical protein
MDGICGQKDRGINSFTAETSSVMILGKAKMRQTILRFHEMPAQGGDDDSTQAL